MKNGRKIVKTIALIALVAVVAACAAVFTACNKDKTKSITDIFKMRESYGEFTSSKLEFTLPAGWEVYTNSTTSTSSTNVSQYSDVGYIPELDAFVVSLNTGIGTKLSIVKCGDKTVYFDDLIPGMMFHPSQGIRALRYKDGLIVCLFDNGSAGAFDAATGREVLHRSKLGLGDNPTNKAYGYSDTNSGNIDSIIKILCGGLIAVHYNYDHASVQGYTSIYRPTYTGEQTSRGELVCRIKNDSNALAQVEGFDDKYATVSGTSNGEYVFKIPEHAPSAGAENLVATSRGSLTTNSKTNYTDEVTYIGDGKFYMCQDWEVSEGNDYTYYNGSKYVMSVRGVYYADSDKYEERDTDTIFNNLTNNYYTSAKAGIDTREYLNDGYTYVSFGLTVYESKGKKYGLYDQFIIDSDMNIVMSLTGNYGVTIKDQTKDKVGFYDLIMFGVDGLYYVPIQPSEINLYDGNGNLVGHNDRTEITRQEYNSNIIVASMPDDNSSSSSLYGAYDRNGDLLVPFEYDMLATFRGLYTIGRRYGRKDVEGESTSTRKLCLIGPDGQEVQEVQLVDKDGKITYGAPFADIAYSSTSASVSNAIYKTGCYMFRVDSGNRGANNSIIYKYGIRNFDPTIEDSVIIPAQMESGSVLYAPTSSPSNVFVFEKITASTTNSVTYVIYRLV